MRLSAGNLLGLFFLLLPAAATAKKTLPFQPSDFCGLGRELNRFPLAEQFSHVTEVELVRRESQFFLERFGACKSIEKFGPGYLLRLENGTVELEVSMSDKKELLKVGVVRAERTKDSVEAAAADFSALVSELSFFVSKNGDSILEKDPDRAFNSGRSRFLPLLSLLSDAIRKKSLTPATQVLIEKNKKAEKAEFLNQFPEGAIFTVDVLKDFVLFYEDESAADHLLALLDRNALNSMEKKSGHYLSSREKDSLRPSAREWFFSPKDLCASIYKLRDDPALTRRGSIQDSGSHDSSLFYTWEEGAFQITKLWKNGAGDWLCASTSGKNLRDAGVAFEVLYITLKRFEKILNRK